MSAATETPRRVRLKAAAAMFGVGYDYLLAAVKKGDLPAIQPQQAFLVKPDDVEDFLVSASEARNP